MVIMGLPDFNSPDLVFYSPANSTTDPTRLNIPNTTNILETSDTEYLYSTPDLDESNIIGKRILNNLAATNDSDPLQSVGQRLSSFIFYGPPATKITAGSSFSILTGQSTSYGEEAKTTIVRVICGTVDFTFVNGYSLRETITTSAFKYSIFFEKNN